jgi:predicted negative regulator of RcsB-dependent stress response
MYDTEEEQVEALRHWWAENGKSVIVGLVVGVSAVVGWMGWKDYKVAHAQEASAMYAQVVEKSAFEPDWAEKVQQTLQSDYADTPYADLAALYLAKAFVESAEYEKAATFYQLVLDNDSSIELTHITRLRLARVFKELNKNEQALALLEGVDQGKFSAMYDDLLGDLYVAKKRPEEAKSAYQKAISNGAVKPDWVQMKLDTL